MTHAVSLRRSYNGQGPGGYLLPELVRLRAERAACDHQWPVRWDHSPCDKPCLRCGLTLHEFELRQERTAASHQPAIVAYRKD